MSSNELVDVMREFGVEVRLLGTDEEPSPGGLAMADMLTEIHRLRADVTARQPAPVVGDEAAIEVAARALQKTHYVGRGWDQTPAHMKNYFRRAARIVLESTLAAQAVQVPEIPDDWWLFRVELAYETGQYRAELESVDASVYGVGSEWYDAIRAAIEQAKGGQE